MKLNIFSAIISIWMICNMSSAQVPTSGLQAYWPFTGNAIDSFKMNNNGTVYGATLTDDRFGNPKSAYYLDGDDYIDVGTDASLRSSSHAINIWFKFSGSTQTAYLANCFNTFNGVYGTGIFYSPIPGLSYSLGSGATSRTSTHFSGRALDDDEWHMLTAMYSTSTNTLAVYLDAAISGNLNVAGSNGSLRPTDNVIYKGNEHWVFGAASFFLSSTNNNGPRYYTGSLDDIRFYNRLLTSSEIEQLYFEGGYQDSAMKEVYDTTYITIYDTTFVNIERYDTVYRSVDDTLYVEFETLNDVPIVRYEFKVYPVPAERQISIDFGELLPKSTNRVILYDITGKKVFEQSITTRSMQINLDPFAAKGHYNLAIVNKNNQVLTVKRIILH